MTWSGRSPEASESKSKTAASTEWIPKGLADHLQHLQPGLLLCAFHAFDIDFQLTASCLAVHPELPTAQQTVAVRHSTWHVAVLASIA